MEMWKNWEKINTYEDMLIEGKKFDDVKDGLAADY